MHFLRLLRGNWGEFQNGMYLEGGRTHLKIRFYRIYIEISQLGRNVIKMALEFKSKRVSVSLTSTIEALREEAELSNPGTAYVMHIPNTLSLMSATNNRKRKFSQRFSSVNFILIMLLQMSFFFFMAAILLCAVRDVRDAQCKTSESA